MILITQRELSAGFQELSSEVVASALRAGAEAGSEAVAIMGARPEVLPSK